MKNNYYEQNGKLSPQIAVSKNNKTIIEFLDRLKFEDNSAQVESSFSRIRIGIQDFSGQTHIYKWANVTPENIRTAYNNLCMLDTTPVSAYEECMNDLIQIINYAAQTGSSQDAINMIDGKIREYQAKVEQGKKTISLFEEKKIPYITVFNKSDLADSCSESGVMYVSALTGAGIHELKEKIASMKPDGSDKRLVADKINAGDLIILVVPIDKAAPKGRLILPQQQAIRDILDTGAAALVTRDTELAETLEKLGYRPDLVITDSQVFGKVDRIIPADVPLTSFSILMARYKGLLDEAVKGVSAISSLRDGDTVLIAEGCTHHRQCGDIGSVKIPKWLLEYTGKDLRFKTVSGTEFPEDLSPYAMVIHCGGCMLSEREVSSRAKNAADQNIPITNYGTMIAFVHGILKRSLGIFPELEKQL